MSPELATRTTDPDTQPLPRRRPGATLDPRLEALVAELAIAEHVPMPVGYCHRCGLSACYGHLPDAVLTCAEVGRPWPFDRWLRTATGAAARAALGDDWLANPLRDELLEAVGKRLVDPRSA